MKRVHETGVESTECAPRITEGSTTETRERLHELKREIEDNRYDVDAPAVADAILRKIRLLKQDRGMLPANGAGRIPLEPQGPQGR
jgi:hypothetical protein